MKKIIIICSFIIVSNPLLSGCPDGYSQTANTEVYKVVPDSEPCPAGYSEVWERAVMPAGGACDPVKGNCSNAGVCQVL